MATNARSLRTEAPQEEQEVPLSGVLAEFRDALRAEIEAARKSAQSSAVQLVHGERVGRSADGHQYLFKLENAQLALPDDMPGDLYVPGRERVDATVISLTGTSLTLAVREDLGQHVPRANLSSNLTNLLRSLIRRIEAVAEEGRENPAGARLLGEVQPSGQPVDGVKFDGLNEEQRAAVASGLGRDTTFIQGPPGTGKTMTIGTLGEQLARADRSVLLVSHTNTAVDQALLHIADALGPEVAAEGKVLRLGEPKDRRVHAQPDLLVRTHVERRSAALVARREELTTERMDHVERLNAVELLLAMCEWAETAMVRHVSLADGWRLVRGIRTRLEQLSAELQQEELSAGHWEQTRTQARTAQDRVEQRPALEANFVAAGRAVVASSGAREQAEATAHREASRLLEATRKQVDELRGLAQSKVEEVGELREQHRQELDQARQVRLLADRFAQMPSASFAQRRVTELKSEVVAAQVAVSAAQASAGDAHALFEHARNVNALTRRMRRLPRADEQEQVVVRAREQESQARSRRAASEHELAEAERQLAETERLNTELDRWRNSPTVEQVEATLVEDGSALEAAGQSLASAEQRAQTLLEDATREAQTLVRAALSRADVAAADSQRLASTAELALDECDSAVAVFRGQHGAEPAGVLAQSEAALARYDALKAERASIANQLSTSEDELRTGLRREREALRLLNVGASMTGDFGALVDELGELVRATVAEAQQQDVVSLRGEADERRGRIRAIETEVASIEKQLEVVEASVIADATVLATTLTRAYLRDEVQNRRFDTVILDEASMAPIPALWVAACVAEANLVIVGDPHQLPPIALAADDKHQDAPEYKWLARDAFEAAGVLDGEPPAHMVKLLTQYRMHPAISAAPNALVYDGELRDDPKATDDADLDPWYDRDWGHDAPVLLVDTEKADAWCSTVVASGRSSRLNFLSATIAVDLAERLLLADREPPEGGEARIIIATPYRPQARLITLLLRDAGLEGEVTAGTVHSFQGSEAPVVIYDLVVDEPHRRAGLFNPAWDEDYKRQFNVGLTRARDRLFVIGDFKFLKSNGKKAFLGRLLAKLDGAPRVEAEDVVPLGLSARAAQSQGIAFGQAAEPTGSERVVVTQRDFDGLFLPDIQAAERRVIIYSPFITHNRLDVVAPQLRAAVERGVSVYVVTKTLGDRNKGDTPAYRELMRTLQRWGVIVVPKKAMHEKLIFIDEDISWVGSLNPLSFRDTREIMERRRSRKVADDYRKTLQLDIVFTAYEQGETTCPICGADMALAEGDRGTYRRCVVPRCYSLGLADPPLREGKMACHTCGGELYYGSWGDKPAWRCHGNKQHRMHLHPNHLRLPAMAGLLTKAELRKLGEMFVSGRSSEASVLAASETVAGAGTPKRQAAQQSLFGG